MSSAGRSVPSPLPGCRQTDTAATFCSPFYNRFVRYRRGLVTQFSNYQTSTHQTDTAAPPCPSSPPAPSQCRPRSRDPHRCPWPGNSGTSRPVTGKLGRNVCTVSHLVIFTVLDQRQHQTIDLVQNLLKTNPQLLEIKVRYPRSSLHFYR